MKKTKRLLSVLLSLLMVISMLPTASIAAMAETATAAKITVETVSANPGTTVDVNINISDNPGILGGVLSLSYDSRLTLVNAVAGDAFSALAMTKPGKFQSPCQFTWDGLELEDSDIKDGTILTLSFQVADSAESGSTLAISASYSYGDFVDANLNSVELNITNGGVAVIAYTPGDVDGNTKVNMTDVILLRRFIAGGYNVHINENAANVNGDTKINMTDVIFMRRFIAGGYGVVLLPSGNIHTHTLESVAAVEATCTEAGNIAYWHCTECGKYYRDINCVYQITQEETVAPAKGHTEVVDAYVAPTYESVGYTEGSHCADCGTVIRARTEIPKLEKNQYFIKYNINNDYLETQDLGEITPTTYVQQDGLSELPNISADGYVFEGWYDGPGQTASKVTSIPVGTSGNKEFYAHWTVKEYTIQFDSPLAPVDSKKYTVSQGATLANPTWFGYTFVGWTNEDGDLVDRILPGTTGDMTLHANWTSLRNQTVPVQNLGDPIIYEDGENGQYMFAYEIGRIENVPLFTIKSFGNTNGITITETVTASGTITSTSASKIAEAVAETTTRSESWCLSEAWNDSTTISQEHASQVSSSVINSSIQSHDETGKWTISSGSGGSKAATHSSGISAKVGAKLSGEAKAGPYKVSAEVSGEVGKTASDSNTNTRNWNTTAGYEGSSHASSSSSSSSSFGTTVSDKSGHSQTKSHNKGTSETKTYALSNTSSREYESSLSYAQSATETTTRSYSNASAPTGWYRLVAAGTVYVFAVVGYDIETRQYYTFTYSIIDDDIYDFVDYSKSTQQFDDYENGVLPFDVPYEVNEYIDDVLFESDGLVVDIDTGKVVDYTGDATSVYVPEYMPVDNGDGTTTVVKVTGFEPTAFNNKKANIQSIKFSKYITEIPDNAFDGYTALTSITAPSVTKVGNEAFKGCSALTTVNMPSITEIGARAFKDCSSFNEYTVTENVTSLGEKAFDGADKVTVRASNSSIAENAIYSGAKQISLTNVSDDAILENKIIVIPDGTEYFEFNGAGKTYHNLRIVSDAATTVINNAILECTTGVPLKLSSENVTLNRLTVDAPEYTMILSADTTTIALYGNVNLDTAGTNSVLSKNMNLVQANPQAVGKMNVSGNVMLCGTITNDSLMTVKSGEVIIIDEDTYNSLANGSLDWVLESEMPLGATVVGEKWTYDLTTTITSANQSEAGYELYETTSEWGPYGAWSNWQDSAVSGSDSRYVETRSVADHEETYLYFYYNASQNKGSLDAKTGYTEQGYWVRSSDVYQWNPYSSRVAYTTNELKALWNYPMNKGSTKTVYKTQYRYKDRSKVYTYHHRKVEAKESSTEITADSAASSNESISNIQKWVQYVM